MDSFTEYLDKMVSEMSEEDIDSYVEEKIREKYIKVLEDVYLE